MPEPMIPDPTIPTRVPDMRPSLPASSDGRTLPMGRLVAPMERPIHAALYDPIMGLVDRAGLAERRRRLLAEARGRVLEVGGGTGLNLRHYRAGDVESVLVLEPD